MPRMKTRKNGSERKNTGGREPVLLIRIKVEE
jgi:hypothetical protein